MTNIVIIIIVVAIVGAALAYIRKEKKRGVRCVGCPDSCACGGKCSSCGEEQIE